MGKGNAEAYLVLTECKSPYIKDLIEEAVEKNFERYQSRGSG